MTPTDAPAPGGLHVFDMDGTLLRSTATIELARGVGQFEAGQEIETMWLEGRITDDDFWSTLLDICKDATEAELEDAFRSAPWMDGIAEAFADIRSRGEHIIVISQSPTFFVRGLEAWGANETYGSAVALGSPLENSATLMPEMKVAITKKALADRNLDEHRCVVYGDSTSDVELFATYPHSVAVNPTATLAPLATQCYLGTDIREAYALGRELLDSTTTKHEAQGSTHT